MDARTLRTKNAIREAFFELLKTKEMKDITLTELSVKANVNRQSIYNYYGGVHEIINDFVNNLFEHYKKIIYQTDVINSFETPMVIFNKINSIIKEDYDFYKTLFTMQHNLILKNQINDFLINIINDVFKKYKVFAPENVDIITTYFVHGLIGCYQYYFDHDNLDLDEYSKYVSELVFGGLKKQIKIK